jgi:hypothetical protein
MQIHAEPDISHLMGTRLVKVHPGNEAETHSSKRIFVDSCCWFLIVITGLMAQLHKCAAIPTRDQGIRGLGKAEIILLLRQLFDYIFPDYIALILLHRKLRLRLINCHTISVLSINLRLGKKPNMLFELLQHNQYELNQWKGETQPNWSPVFVVILIANAALKKVNVC